MRAISAAGARSRASMTGSIKPSASTRRDWER
jgi:hypothetical protein